MAKRIGTSSDNVHDRSNTMKSSGRICGTMQQHFYLLETVANFRTNQMKLEHECKARLRSALVARAAPSKISVVVHVVHNTAMPAEKISIAQVKSQIEVLNQDFRAKNADKVKTPSVFSGFVADAMIEFELATKGVDHISGQLIMVAFDLVGAG